MSKHNKQNKNKVIDTENKQVAMSEGGEFGNGRNRWGRLRDKTHG